MIAIQITIQLSDELASALQSGDTDMPEVQMLTDMVAAFGAELRPLHPGSNDPTLTKYYTLDVVDAEAAEALLNRLWQFEAVEAAYVKPPDELP